MALSAGAVVAQFDGDFAGLNNGLKNAEKNINEFVSNIDKNAKNVTKNFQSISNASKKVGGAISLYITAPLTAAFGLVSKQAIDQVKQVQNASAGLRAYEKDGKKVNAVLKELVNYAQSDTGVLFQRADLFDAANTLKLFGTETEDLVSRVKIMSKGVVNGKTTFQELSTILGRVGATGKLTAVDFDMLIERGIGLDKSMRGTDVTAQSLFEAMDKALPDELLNDRASSIDGQMIRLQSAFRNVGASILGVNDTTDGFMPGSIGERIFQTAEKLRQFTRSAEFIDLVKHAGDRLVSAFDAVVNVVTKLYNWFITLSPEQKKLATDILLVVTVLGPLLLAFGAFMGMIAFAISPLVMVAKAVAVFAGFLLGLNPITLAIIGVIAAFAGIAFLVIKNWNQVSERFRNLWKEISSSVSRIGESIKNGFKGAVDYVNDLISKWNPLNKVSGLVSGIGNILKGRIPGHANGVRNFVGGLSIVGERGPELVNLPRGADVYSNEESRAMTGGITIETMNIKSGVDWELGASYMAQKLRLS